jgi:hypothetical protein
MIKLNLRKNLQSPGSARPVKTSFSSFNETTVSPLSDETAFSSHESKPKESQSLHELIRKISYFVFILLLSFGSFASAQSEIDTSLQKKYASSCEFVKSDFKTYIRPNDLKTRLEQVRIYEKIISDQQSVYDRLKANNQHRDGIKLSVQNQRDNLNSFKLKFEAYDDNLKKILALDCKNDSTSMGDLVGSARKLRNEAQQLLNYQKTLTAEGAAALKDVAAKLEPRVSEK